MMVLKLPRYSHESDEKIDRRGGDKAGLKLSNDGAMAGSGTR